MSKNLLVTFYKQPNQIYTKYKKPFMTVQNVLKIISLKAAIGMFFKNSLTSYKRVIR